MKHCNDTNEALPAIAFRTLNNLKVIYSPFKFLMVGKVQCPQAEIYGFALRAKTRIQEILKFDNVPAKPFDSYNSYGLLK